MPNAFIEPFVTLGQRLDEAYRRANYAEAAFAELAYEHVSQANLHEHFELGELARWLLSLRNLPPQHDIHEQFGQPPITLWSGRRFFVSALVWRTSTTAIHQHGFTGAFQVLVGSSVHSRYRFHAQRELSEDLATGTLECTSVERLTAGMARPIPASSDGIHSLFHLEHPSVSLVVRSHSDVRHPIQYDYRPPGLAVWNLRAEPEHLRARQVARMLLRVDRARGKSIISEALQSATPYDAFALLDEARLVSDLSLALELLDDARVRLGDQATSAFDAVLRESARVTQLIRKRDSVREPTLRYLLAILLNAPTRKHALALAEAHTPERHGADSLVSWLAELTTVKLKLQAGGVPWEPNVLGLPEPDERSLVTLRRVLSGESVESGGPTPFFDAVRRNSAFEPLFRD